jgi:peptidyl-prolyl cis-trans isomerase A (cyclophilin A)
MKQMRWVLAVMHVVLFVSLVQAADSSQAEGKASEAPNKAKTQEPPVVEEKEKVPNPVVKMVTNKGEIQIELEVEKAPITVANFLKYAQSDFYNGTIFHRVIKDFMIQGGGFNSDMQQKKTNPPIKNESDNGLRNNRGTIAMARTNNPNAFLNGGKGKPGYAVFGKVIAGMDVVNAIAAVSTRHVGSHGNVPVEPVVIESVIVTEAPSHENEEEGHEGHDHHEHDGDDPKSGH